MKNDLLPNDQLEFDVMPQMYETGIIRYNSIV
jgi:hypothetical protein